MQLNSAKILVTGGSLGIGKETAKICSEAGAEVVITGRDEKRLNKTAEEIGAIPVVFDVSDYSSIEEKTDLILDRLGGIDALINNAGVGEYASLEEISLELFEKIFSTNVFGLALLTQKVAAHMKQKEYGTIINLGSTASMKGYAKGTVYAASKFAVRGMTQCWQAELRKFNIRVCQVNPSEVTTAFAQPDRKERDNVSNKLRPLEVAHTIKAMLEMDDRGFITESTIFATNPWD